MGVFHLECAACELPIISHPVELVLVVDTPDGYVPAALPIRGEYDSYGSIENIEEDGNVERLLGFFRELANRRELSVGDRKLDTPESLEDLLGEIRQAQVDDIWLNVRGQSLGFTLVLENFYSAVVRTVERDPSAADCHRAGLVRVGRDALIRQAFGDLDLPRAFYSKVSGRAADEIMTGLVELVQFRHWFDSRGSWFPDPFGDQYADDDIPPFIAKAKKELASWPLLLEAVRDYERDFEASRDEDDEHPDLADADDSLESFGIDPAFPEDDDEDEEDVHSVDHFEGMDDDESDDEDDQS